jgi:hypothetical protein
MALVTFRLNELAVSDLPLAERVEDEIRRGLARYEPRDLLVECRITLQGARDEARTRIGIMLSTPGGEGRPGWARAFGLPLDGTGAWLSRASLDRVLGLWET